MRLHGGDTGLKRHGRWVTRGTVERQKFYVTITSLGLPAEMIAQVTFGSSRLDTTRHVRRVEAHSFWLCRACQTARLDTLDTTSLTRLTRSTCSTQRARQARLAT